MKTVFLKVVALAALLASTAWLARQPSWEPLISFLVCLAAYAASEITSHMPLSEKEKPSENSPETVQSDHVTEKLPLPAPSTEKPAPKSTKKSLKSLSNYYAKVKSLRDRFAEKHHFEQSCIGRKITWKGFVDNVEIIRENSAFIRVIDHIESFPIADSVLLICSEDFYTRALALKKGDYIKFSGEVIEGLIGPRVQLEELDTLTPAS